MRPIKQTIEGEYVGNCFQAAIASILDLELLDVPHFCVNGNPKWHSDLKVWCVGRDLALFHTDVDDESVKLTKRHPDVHYLVAGKSGDIWHTVIGNQGELVFDPHVRNTMIEEPMEFTFILPNNRVRFLEDENEEERVVILPNDRSSS